MPARQFEPGLFMLSQRERRGTVALEIVTLVALVLVRFACELVVVFVLVTVGAALEVHDLEDRVFAFRRVALLALQFGVPVDQRIGTLGVRLHIKQRRLPSLNVVATGTLDAVRLPLGELSFVIVLVAVGAFGKRELLLEVSIRVALNAFDCGVLSLERVLGLRMIEVTVQTVLLIRVSSAGVVA